jgi:hypothetical protein
VLRIVNCKISKKKPTPSKAIAGCSSLINISGKGAGSVWAINR